MIRLEGMEGIVPAFLKTASTGKFISSSTKVFCEIPVIREILGKAVTDSCISKDSYGCIRLIKDVPEKIRRKVSKEFALPFTGNGEAYILDAAEDISIYSLTERGLLYGTMSLLQQLEGSYLSARLAYEYPVCETRGIKIYLPAPEDIDYFRKVIDMACFYKYNTVIIEVGGAMEYRTHPEINTGWIEYCRDMNSYSNRSKEIQEHTFGWKKNSIHAENGGGRFLDQETVAGLVDYCKERYLEVIPEMPSLSHCDYLMIRHPELKERIEDPYPDTYCPSNPASYNLLFDLLGEVIEVFRPETLHIGHDEYYSIGLCEKCRVKKAEELYAGDIKKIYDFLKVRGIRTMLWGDKLLDAFYQGYGPCGGARSELHHPITGEYTGTIPATHGAIDLIPEDIRILHWYWGVDGRLEKQFLERDMETIYGNFSGPDFPEWKTRLERGIKGAVISNWSALKEENLQRNGFFYNLVFSGLLFWHPGYAEDGYEKTRKTVFQELFKYRLLHEPENGIQSVEKESWLDILHGTDFEMEYSEFTDGTFIDKEHFTIGSYILSYRDGSEAEIPVVYGQNISSLNVSWKRELESEFTMYSSDKRLMEVSYTTCPAHDNGSSWYRYICKNPNPSSSLTGIRIKCTKTGSHILLRNIRLTGRVMKPEWLE